MTTAIHPTPVLDLLASRLEQDIRQKGLWAGERYLTASEAAEMLGVSTAAAHRAMKILSQRRMLVRHRSRGTFVGPHFDMKRSSTIRTVYALMASPGLDTDTVPLESFIFGIRAGVSNANVQMSFLPREGDPMAYICELIHMASEAGRVAGFVPVSCSRQVYRRLADSGMSTVIFGTPYIDQQDIPSVDVDNHAAGRLLTEHLTGCGHRRIAVLTAMEGQPGSNRFFDGVSEALTEADLPHNAMVLRIVPVELATVTAQLRELLSMPERPTAVIARTPTMARRVSMAMDQLELPAADRFEIVYENHPAIEGSELPFTYVQPRISFAEIIGRIGAMLERIGKGETLDEPHVVIPLDLCPKSLP